MQMSANKDELTKAIKTLIREEVKLHVKDYAHLGPSYIDCKIRETVRKRCEGDRREDCEYLREYKKAHNAGMPWSTKEDDMLRGEISQAIKTMADAHGRSYGAIRSRLNHLSANVPLNKLITILLEKEEV